MNGESGQPRLRSGFRTWTSSVGTLWIRRRPLREGDPLWPTSPFASVTAALPSPRRVIRRPDGSAGGRVPLRDRSRRAADERRSRRPQPVRRLLLRLLRRAGRAVPAAVVTRPRRSAAGRSRRRDRSSSATPPASCCSGRRRRRSSGAASTSTATTSCTPRCRTTSSGTCSGRSTPTRRRSRRRSRKRPTRASRTDVAPSLSPDAKAALLAAYEESRELGASYVGPEHVLLALARDDETAGGPTARSGSASRTRSFAAPSSAASRRAAPRASRLADADARRVRPRPHRSRRARASSTP